MAARRKARGKRSARRARTSTGTRPAKSARRGAGSGRRRALRGAGRGPSKKKWSAEVMRKSDALDLEKGVFKKKTPLEVALSLKRSAEHSRRRKAEPYASAMSMLNFHINRAGRQLPAERRKVLTQAKGELRRLFHRET